MEHVHVGLPFGAQLKVVSQETAASDKQAMC